MRRYLAAVLLLVLVAQASGSAVAATPDLTNRKFSIGSQFALLLSSIEGSAIVAQLSGNGERYALMHSRKPVFAARAQMRIPINDNVSRSRLSPVRVRRGRQFVLTYPSVPPRVRTTDPLAVRSAAVHHAPAAASNAVHLSPVSAGGAQRRESSTMGAAATAGHLALGRQRPAGALHTLAAPSGSHERLQQQALATSDAGAGINRYWEYEEHAIPGIGKAMLNVGTGNLVIQATDLAIPERGLGLVFQRTYNSQSLHDANGDDAAEPNIFGNGWTNNYDAHIVYQPTTGDISVYDIDGTRCDYAPSAGGWLPCAGEHAILEVDPNTACAYWWIKKNGTAYWFHTDDPGPGCSFGQGETGRLYKIIGRNKQ